MDAPKCRTCGERHWDRVCPTPPAVAKSRNVTAPVRSVVRNVTANPRSDLIGDLEAEIKMLKRKLAESHAELEEMRASMAKLKDANAERVRQHRAKQKATP